MAPGNKLANPNYVFLALSLHAIYIFQTTATIESIIVYTRHAFSNSNICQTTATCKRVLADTHHSVWNVDRFEPCAFIECLIANTRHAVTNGNGGKTRAISESTHADTRHVVRNSYWCQATASIESPCKNTRHTTWNIGVITTQYQCIGFGLYNCIAVIPRIINLIPWFHLDRRQTATTRVFATYCVPICFA